MLVPKKISLLFLILAGQAIAWGEHGHRTVAYLAQLYFTADGEALYNDLIAPKDDFDISDGAVWADSFTTQKRMPFSKPWHFIDANDDPPTACKVTYTHDCSASKGCVVEAIMNMTSRVNDPSISKQEQGIAFKFLLHFLGDITQPLHTEKKCRGGTRLMVQWGKPDSKKEKLHDVWDSLIIKKLRKYKAPHGDPENVYDKSLALSWATDLHGRSEELGLDLNAECVDIKKAKDCSLKWANEANKFVCSYVMIGESLGPDKDEDDCQWEWNGPEDLSKGYYEGAVPIVEGQVAKAGARLGAWINALATQRTEMKGQGVRFDDNDDDQLLAQREWEL